MGLLAISLVSLGLSRAALGHERVVGPLNGLRLLAAATAVCLGFSDSQRAHAIAVIFVFALFTTSIVVLLVRAV